MQTYVRGWLSVGIALAGFGITNVASAGVPECGNLRLKDVGGCELRTNLSCMAGCEELGVYKKACATKLRTVCSNDCTFAAEPTCTDSCTETCTESCDRGENVICIHNCFSECTVSCDAACEGAEDPDQCMAGCEANCDAECDIKCKPLVDGDCYTHCIECCGGSCTAEANLDCQLTCQEEEFEDCEYELRADCSASCSGMGAIFCDGEFVLEGPEIIDCAQALAKQGIAEIDLEASLSGSIEDGVADVGGRLGVGDGDGKAKVGGCSASGDAPRSGLLVSLLVAAVGLTLRRRRAQG